MQKAQKGQSPALAAAENQASSRTVWNCPDLSDSRPRRLTAFAYDSQLGLGLPPIHPWHRTAKLSLTDATDLRVVQPDHTLLHQSLVLCLQPFDLSISPDKAFHQKTHRLYQARWHHRRDDADYCTCGHQGIIHDPLQLLGSCQCPRLRLNPQMCSSELPALVCFRLGQELLGLSNQIIEPPLLLRVALHA